MRLNLISFSFANSLQISNFPMHIIEKDIPVLCATVKTFPDGIMEAYDQIEKAFPDRKGRLFYGLSKPNLQGIIVYKAAIEQKSDEEAEKFGLEKFIIPAGTYVYEDVVDFSFNPSEMIGGAFRRLLSDARIDPTAWCIETHTGDDTVRCMVRILEK